MDFVIIRCVNNDGTGNFYTQDFVINQMEIASFIWPTFSEKSPLLK